jgi:hypothetical protein
MPLIKTQPKPAHGHPELVNELARELRDPKPQGGTGVPDIYEERQTFGNHLNVRVVWDKWEGIPHAERGPIILDAYRKARDEVEMLNITLALGLTPDENRRLGVES